MERGGGGGFEPDALLGDTGGVCLLVVVVGVAFCSPSWSVRAWISPPFFAKIAALPYE